MKPFLFAALICISIAGFMGWMTGEIPSEATYCEVNEQTKQENCTVDNIALVAFRKTGKFLEESSDAITALASIAIAFFTWTLYRATNALWEAGERQRRHFERTESAFAFVRSFNATPLADADGAILGWRVGPCWGNEGNTPTRNAFQHVSWGQFPPLPEPGPESVAFEDRWGDGVPHQNVRVLVPPKGMIQSETVDIWLADLIAIQRGDFRFCMWGWIEYDDIFDGTSPHRTEFCSEIIVRGDPSVANAAHIGFSQYRLHNGAEQECLQQARPANQREFT